MNARPPAPATRPDEKAASRSAAEMMEQASAASDLLKALSHEMRLLILCLLSEGEKSVSEIEAFLGLSQAAVSQHLARLRQDDLVACRREGRMIYYSIARPEARAVIETLYGLFCGKAAHDDAPSRPRSDRP